MFTKKKVILKLNKVIHTQSHKYSTDNNETIANEGSLLGHCYNIYSLELII